MPSSRSCPRANPGRRPFALAAAGLATSLVAAPASAQQLTVGGFDLARGGDFSLSDGVSTRDMRDRIAAAFPGSQITGSPSLTDGYLGTLDAIFLSSIACLTATCEISPLTADEQAALRRFAEGGGAVLLFGENNDFLPAAQSLFEPFDATLADGIFREVFFVGVPPIPGDPIFDGPFGTIEEIRVGFPGWFEDLGQYAQTRASFADRDVLAVIEPGELAPGSGSVVLTADSSMLIYPGEVFTLTLNTLGTLSCPADLDGDGVLTIFDFLGFQNLFDAGDPAADFDGDGSLTIFDFLAFQNAFDRGC
jgi:hypothetical protein